MKILHSSDWHIGQQFYNYDRSEEHQDFFDQLTAMVETRQPDALLVSGDVFHSGAPSAASRRLYTDSMIRLHRACPGMQIIVTAGNHDSSSYLEADGQLWDLAHVKVIGRFSRPDDHVLPIIREGVPLGYVVALPHAYPQNIPDFTDAVDMGGCPDGSETALPADGTARKLKTDRLGAFVRMAVSGIADDGLPVVVMAHTTVSGFDYTEKLENVGSIDTVSLDTMGNGFDYLALGHIHKPQSFQSGNCLARYCGSPVAVSFAEEYGHSVSLVHLASRGELPEVEELPVKALIPVKTIPFKPMGLDATLDFIKDHPFRHRCYVRVQISMDSYLPVDSADRVSKAVAQAGALYCQIKSVRTEELTSQAAVTSMDVSQLRESDPLDIAKKYYNSKYQRDLSPELENLLMEVLSDCCPGHGDEMQNMA